MPKMPSTRGYISNQCLVDNAERSPQFYQILGIDPGAKGGLACWCPSRGNMQSISMPSSERDIYDWFEGCALARHTIAVIERQVPRPTFFKGKSSILKSTCELYGQYMLLRGILTGLKIKFYEVLPQAWQKELGFGARIKDMTDSKWKETLRAKAQQFFPSIDLWEDKTRGYKGRQMAVADAILLCEYGVRKHG